MTEKDEMPRSAKPPKAIKPVKKGRYKNPAAMIQDLAENETLAERSIRSMSQRCIIDHLMAQRTLHGLSQSDIAEKMGCTQSRVSKLENGVDDDLRIGDFHAYTAALGLEMSILLARRQPKLVDLIRGHALALRELFKRLASLAKDDSTINHGAMNFLVEVASNFVDMLKTTAEELKALRLPAMQEPAPLIRVENGGGEEPSCGPEPKAGLCLAST